MGDSSAYQKELDAARRKGPEHENDDRWTAVDNYAIKHLHTSQNTPYYDGIQNAIKLSADKGLPAIEVSLFQGKWLVTQCQAINAKHILEVGTLGGISSILMASSGPDVQVTSIEIDPERKAVADEAIKNAGLGDRVKVLLGRGIDRLADVRKEVESGQRPKFDLVFIDADKPNNLNYYNEAVAISRSRACVIVDNVVRRGRLADDSLVETDVSVRGAREVIEAAGKDDRIMGTTLVQTVGEKSYDGVLICIVK